LTRRKSALVLARKIREYLRARRLFVEYSQDIGQDLCFNDFRRELAELEIRYRPDEGGKTSAVRSENSTNEKHSGMCES